MFKAMMMTTALSFAAVAATADTITLSSEIEGASLHEGAVDMVVYYVERGGALEVVSTYASAQDPSHTGRVTMALGDGDAVAFAMPGLTHVRYAFAREGFDVTVRAELVGTAVSQIAQ